MFKKLLLKLTVILCLVGLFVNNNSFKVSAYSQSYKYEYACDLDYSVDYINDDGTFANIGCYSDFASAKAKMQENNDYVVRHKNGYSPTRIVAMNSGIVYSYYRGTSSDETITIYEGVKGLTDNTHTYVARYFQMEYIDTNYMSENTNYEGQGYVHINLGGFDGYADLEYTDLVPSKYIDNAIPIYLGGPYGGNSKEPYLTIVEPDYYTIEQNGNYTDLVLHYHNAYPDSNGKSTCWNMSIGSANDFTFLSAGTRYYSPDGINFYNSYKNNSRTLIGTGYNYYQYLPLRTKSNISADTLNNFIIKIKGSGTDSVIKNKGSVFMSGQNDYGSNAAIVFAMACWESAYGTSNFAVSRNNLFGWKAYDYDPSGNAYTFSSVDSCIIEHAGGNLRDYSDYDVSWFNGAFLGNKGAGFNLKYASDPYWGAGIASIYYRLDKYAAGDNGSLVDYNKYDLGIVATMNAPIYSDTSASSVLFYCNYSDSRNKNYMVTLLEDTGSYYKIQLANPINNGSLVTRVDGAVTYDWTNSIGYIKKSDISKITNNNAITIATKEHSALTLVNSTSLNNGTLTIGGIGLITNYDFDNTNNVVHTINVYNITDNSLIKSYACSNTNTSWYNINDGCNYTYGGFSGDINLNELNVGTYYLTLKTSLTISDSTISREEILCSSQDGLHMNIYNGDSNTYSVLTNDIYSYRFEIDVFKTYSELNYSGINKPSTRSSMSIIDSISFDENNLMTIKGESMIYYTDYASQANYHTLYLVNDSNIYELTTTSYKSSLDYKSLLGSNYNLDYISYEASIDCDDIATGTYRIIMEINNNGNLDYVELTNDYGFTYANIDTADLTCNLSVDTIRSRMLLNVTNN